jgi:transposase
MRYATTIGIDSHSMKNDICAIIMETGEKIEDSLPSDADTLIKWINTHDFPKPLRCGYESGPTGFTLARKLNKAGIACEVIAVSKLPKRIDRKKNDRVDAEWLARMLLAGGVRMATIPSEAQESLRNLSRLRGECAKELTKAKQRVTSFLLVMGVRYTQGKKHWSLKFKKWVQDLELSNAHDTFCLRDKLAEVAHLEGRLKAIEQRILDAIKDDGALSDSMARLKCLYGIGDIVAFSIICEAGDISRFRNGAAFASYLGLVPSESSSGLKQLRGSITKAGNSHLRRYLIEAASTYSRPMRLKEPDNLAVDSIVRQQAHKCSRRLKMRREHLAKKGKSANKAKVAIARELAEMIYNISVM